MNSYKHALNHINTFIFIPDIPVLQVAGLSACPQDAVIDVKSVVDYQSPFDGGETCVRDIIEQTLRVQGKWLSDLAYQW